MIDAGLSIVDQQTADPSAAWQQARHRVLVRSDLHCETCGAEHGRRVWKHLYDPRTWWPVVPGVTPHRQDLGVVEVIVIVVPIALPWSGEDADLSALCMGCYFTREVDRARFHSSGRHKRKAQRRLFEC